MTTFYPCIITDPDEKIFRIVGTIAFSGASPSGTVTVTDGTTTVTPVSTIDFASGAVVTDGGGGTADVAVNAAIDGGSSVSTYLVSQVIDGGTA